MDRYQNAKLTNLDLLNRLQPLSFLSPEELRQLARSLHSAQFRKGEVILPGRAQPTGLHILLTGVAKITRLNRCGERVTVALLAPGPIPELLSLAESRWHFRCEARSDCKVGSVGWDQFDIITKAASQSDLRRFHENNLMRWCRWDVGFQGFDLRERLLIALRELSSNFGVTESRGTLLRIPLSHKDLADLVGASRPRVTEHLAELEREHRVIRQGRQLIVCSATIENSSALRQSDPNDSIAGVGAPAHFPKEGRLHAPHSLAMIAQIKPLIHAPSASTRSRSANRSIAVA